MYDGVFDNQIGAVILLFVVAPNLLIYTVARGVNSVIISIRARSAPKLPIEIYAKPQAQTPEIVPPPAEPVLVRPPKLSSKLKSEKNNGYHASTTYSSRCGRLHKLHSRRWRHEQDFRNDAPTNVPIKLSRDVYRFYCCVD
jgi:hypothetical protein